jgi:hypothetical protein
MNSKSASSTGASLPTRFISAVAGGGLAYLAASYFFAALPIALAAAALVALVGLIAPKWLLLPVAGIVVPTYRLGKYLSGKAYHGLFPGIFNAMLGLASSIGAAMATATYVGWANGLSVLLWFPACCIAFVVTLFIIEPAVYLGILKPVCDGLEKLWDATRDFLKKYAKDLFGGIVNAAKLLPGSSSLWAWVENKEKGAQWVDGFMGFVTVVGSIGLTGTVAYSVFHFVAPFAAILGVSWLVTGATWFAAGVVAIAVIGVLYQLIDKGELPFVATALSGAGVYALQPVIASFGFGLVGTVAISAVGFVLALAYVYPAVHGLLKTGLIKAILDGVKTLVRNTYDDKDADYRKFFAHVVTPVVALTAGGVAFWALSFYGLPIALVLAVAGVTAFTTYAGVGEAFDDFPTTIATGGMLSLAVGAGSWYFFAEGANGYILWPSLVATVAVTFAVILPLIYQAIRFVTHPIAKPVGTFLGDLNKKAYTAVRDLTKWWDKSVIEKTYEDRSDYKGAFLHTFNAVVLGLGVWQALPLTAGFLGLPSWAIIAGLAVSAYLVYMVLGRILLSVGVGAVGIAVGVASFAGITWSLYQADPSKWYLAAIVAASFASAIAYVVTPVVLLAVKALLGWAINGIGFVLGKVYDFLWARFEVVADAFVSVCKFVNNWLFMPFIRLIGGLINAIVDVWNSMFGRK